MYRRERERRVSERDMSRRRRTEESEYYGDGKSGRKRMGGWIEGWRRWIGDTMLGEEERRRGTGKMQKKKNVKRPPKSKRRKRVCGRSVGWWCARRDLVEKRNLRETDKRAASLGTA